MHKVIENRFKKSALAAPDRILVATDLTDTEYLVPYVIAQAQAAVAAITLLHAVLPSKLVPSDPAAEKTKIVRDARDILLGVARQIESRGITCNTAVREGRASEVIREELDRTDATRLILGTHGRGKLGRLAHGSVAQELICSVNIPVFLVGPHARDTVEHATPRRILHPASLMGDYQDSVDFALELARTYKAELTLLHVLDPDVAEEVNPERTIDWAKHALEALAPVEMDLVPPIRTLVTMGELAEEILKVADQANADWIVLGVNRGHRFSPFNESATYQVLTTATRPVLTLRHEPHHAAHRKLEEGHFTSPL